MRLRFCQREKVIAVASYQYPFVFARMSQDMSIRGFHGKRVAQTDDLMPQRLEGIGKVVGRVVIKQKDHFCPVQTFVWQLTDQSHRDDPRNTRGTHKLAPLSNWENSWQ